MRAKIEELKQRHNPAQTELRMCHFFLQARRGKNDDAKRQVMPVVRSLVPEGGDRPYLLHPCANGRSRPDGAPLRRRSACGLHREAGSWRDRDEGETKKAPRLI